MLEFDLALLSKLSLTESVFYRYCDDIFVICDSEKEDEVYEYVNDEIRKLGLNLQEKKTEIRQFVFDAAGKLRADKPVHYLGFSFDGQREHIRSSSITRYYKKLRKRIWVSKKAMERCNDLRAGRGSLRENFSFELFIGATATLGAETLFHMGFGRQISWAPIQLGNSCVRTGKS